MISVSEKSAVTLLASLEATATRINPGVAAIKGAWNVFPTSHNQSAQRGSYLFDETLTAFPTPPIQTSTSCQAGHWKNG